MTARRALLVLALGLLPWPAAGQRAEPRRRRRRLARRAEPLPAPPPAPPIRGEPAPVPNRDLEAPREPEAARAALAPRINPALIDPAEPRIGATTDRHSPQAREDRLLREPAAGARLSLPFAY